MRRVAVLGTGIMGAGMARSLLRSGLDVVVWNRSPGRAAPLAADGAQVAGTAAEAVTGADAVVTMLWDGGSVAEVMTAALPAAPGGVVGPDEHGEPARRRRAAARAGQQVRGPVC
jgi:3-hydroxyisobutyrate dehydrogenase